MNMTIILWDYDNDKLWQEYHLSFSDVPRKQCQQEEKEDCKNVPREQCQGLIHF